MLLALWGTQWMAPGAQAAPAVHPMLVQAEWGAPSLTPAATLLTQQCVPCHATPAVHPHLHLAIMQQVQAVGWVAVQAQLLACTIKGS